MKRAVVIVLDSVGIGELPDASKFGDEGSNTLVNIKKEFAELDIKNMVSLGIGNIDGENIDSLGKVEKPKACYGKMAEASFGKDTTTGHWEIAGIITEKPFPTFTKTGFPPNFIKEFEKAIGKRVLGNYAESGTVIIQKLGEEHIRTGSPIVYTSADSVFQIAAHEDVIKLDELYKICQTARSMLKGDIGVARVIARPFTGSVEKGFTRTKNRKDFSLPPSRNTILDYASLNKMTVAAVGKTEDIFQNRGITESYHTTNNSDGIQKTIELIKNKFDGIIFTNLVDFDMLYGHRNDIKGYAEALEYFDTKLNEIINVLDNGDILFITADHGCDPTTKSTDHSREYVPILAYNKNMKNGFNLGTRKTFSDVAATISEYLELNADVSGKSFLNEIKSCIPENSL